MKYGIFLRENCIKRYEKEYIKYDLLKDIITITKNNTKYVHALRYINS